MTHTAVITGRFKLVVVVAHCYSSAQDCTDLPAWWLLALPSCQSITRFCSPDSATDADCVRHSFAPRRSACVCEVAPLEGGAA